VGPSAYSVASADTPIHSPAPAPTVTHTHTHPQSPPHPHPPAITPTPTPTHNHPHPHPHPHCTHTHTHPHCTHTHPHCTHTHPHCTQVNFSELQSFIADFAKDYPQLALIEQKMADLFFKYDADCNGKLDKECGLAFWCPFFRLQQSDDVSDLTRPHSLALLPTSAVFSWCESFFDM
jgi:hypothetical protein